MKCRFLLYSLFFLFITSSICFASIVIEKDRRENPTSKDTGKIKNKNCIIVYYSKGGNTRRVAENLRDVLKGTYSVTVKRIFYVSKKDTLNFSKYDLIAFGSPVHFREFVPEIQEYIRNISDISGKEVILFVTYGSGIGRQNALRNQEIILRQKGVDKIKKIAYPGIYTIIKNDEIANILKIFLQDKIENTNVIPKYIPLMDIYPSDTVRLSGVINYKDSLLKERSGALAIWSKRTFKEGGIPDIDIIDITNLGKETAELPNRSNYQGFEISVPKKIGDIYLGIIDYNIMDLARPHHILNTIKNFPLNVKDNNISNININVVYKKVYIQGKVKEEGSFLLEEKMRVMDLIKKAGGFLKAPEELRITVHRNSPSKGISNVINKLPANNPLANILLEAGDYIFIEE